MRQCKIYKLICLHKGNALIMYWGFGIVFQTWSHRFCEIIEEIIKNATNWTVAASFIVVNLSELCFCFILAFGNHKELSHQCPAYIRKPCSYGRTLCVPNSPKIQCMAMMNHCGITFQNENVMFSMSTNKTMAEDK